MAFTNYKLGQLTDYITGEVKALTDPMHDPVILNFKFFINFEKNEGLFADEKHVNSALAYLKRIGETARYNLLKKFINNFRNVINDYEHLFLGIDGLDLIQNAPPYQLFGSDEDKINLKIYEPIDFKIQSLVTAYRKILYDDTRGVEVLPINMQRFDCHVFVFNHGYYNELLYGTDDADKHIERRLFPTKDKIINNKFAEMHHQIFTMEQCTFDVTESGKDFITNVSNEMRSDFVVNNLTFKFKFAQYSARFAGVFGDFDFDSLLALDSLQKNYENSADTLSDKIDFKDLTKNEILRFDSMKKFIKSRRKIITDGIEQIKSTEFKKQAIKSFAKIGGNYLKNRVDFIRQGLDGVNKLNSLVMDFNPTLNIRQMEEYANTKIYDRFASKVEFKNNINPYYREGNQFYDKNIELKEYNIYEGGL